MSPGPDNRTTTAVAAIGSAVMVMVGVQAPALIPTLGLGLLTSG